MRCSGLLAFSALGALAVAVTGCAAGGGTAVAAPAATGAIHGSVHGGQQPVTGATIQLWAISVSGDGTASTQLLSAPVITDGTGSFTITNLYACSTYTTGAEAGMDYQVYLTSTGGNPGLPAGRTNSAIALMSALGDCLTLQDPAVFLDVNEETTVAAVAQLAPYMTSYSAVGAGDSDFSSMMNALFSADSMVSVVSGTSIYNQLGPPALKINELSDILAACINSPGGVAGDGSPCGLLFLYATPPSGPAPTDTIGAMLNIANFPTRNAASLATLIAANAPFQPAGFGSPGSWAVLPGPVQNSQVQITTPSGDGIVHIPFSQGQPGKFMVTATYKGTVSLLPVTIYPLLGIPLVPSVSETICETNGVGQCISSISYIASTFYQPNATGTFEVFVTATAMFSAWRGLRWRRIDRGRRWDFEVLCDAR
jgi:hypothetical protein